jgi:putative sigma-54 modulation protein
MQFSVTFRHMEATEALKEYARGRLEKIRKYFPDPISVHAVMSAEKQRLHRVDVTVQLHNGFRLAGHETTENMYSSIDLVSAKIERQVRRYHDKLRGHKSRDLPPVTVVHSVLHEVPGEHAPEFDAEHQASSDGSTAPGITGSAQHLVIRREQFDATPMSVSEAIMQLNLLHEEFHVFRNEQTGQVNVVYRRADGAYGLIETGQPT